MSQGLSSIQVHLKSTQQVLCNPADKPTHHKQTKYMGMSEKYDLTDRGTNLKQEQARWFL